MSSEENKDLEIEFVDKNGTRYVSYNMNHIHDTIIPLYVLIDFMVPCNILRFHSEIDGHCPN